MEGLNVDQQDDDGCTPLMRLLGTSIPNRKLAEALPLRESLCLALLNRKADPCVKDSKGWTALHHLMATRGELPEGRAYAKVEENIVNKLKARKADLNASDKEGVTVLMVTIAADNGLETKLQLDRVRCLIKNGANVEKRDKAQRSALIYAALGVRIVEQLVQGPTDTKQGYAQYGCADLLLDNGATLNKRAVVEGLAFPWIQEVMAPLLSRTVRPDRCFLCAFC